MKVLFIVDNAPDYREEFFRCLGEQCSLTVLSHPCNPDGLNAPETRKNYHYIEINIRKRGPFFFLASPMIDISGYDVLCVDLNPRHLWRFFLFMKNKPLWNRWLWWGHIYGRSNNPLLNFTRKQFLKRPAAILAYSSTIATRVENEMQKVPVLSINNSQARIGDFMKLDWPESDALHFIFVGRPQERKRLDRIINLAHLYPLTKWRLIGPGMADYIDQHFGPAPDNVSCYDKSSGEELKEHFTWCHAVVNPGHLGLLISNAALHGRPVVIQTNEEHAPEIILAKESAQIFIDFDNKKETDLFFNELMQDISALKLAALRLQDTAKTGYTIENMVEKHMEGFRIAYSGYSKT